MARMGLTKGERTTLKNCWGTATLFFPIVFDSLSMIGPQITMTALSAIVQSPNQKIPDRKTKCVIKTHINIKQNVIFGAKLKPV